VKHTDLIVILDRSGSMAGLARDMEGGFDQLIREQARLKGSCNVTLVQFDSQAIDTVYTGTPVGKVPPLSLEPRGGTPLLDAVGSSLAAASQQIAGLPAARRPEQVMVIIITDGAENASHEYTLPQVRALVEKLSGEGWRFVYLGANVDAFAEAGSMGIAAMSAAAYQPDSASAGSMFVAASANLATYRAGSYTGFSDAQRKAMNPSTTNAMPTNINPTGTWAFGGPPHPGEATP